MRATAVALLFLLLGAMASESVLAGKGFWPGVGRAMGSGGTQSGGQSRPQASGHHHGHHHPKSFVGVGVGFGFAYPWGWWYPPPYSYYPYPVGYPAEPVTYIEQGGPPAAAEPGRWWYYCESSTGYYPYVQECPAGWQRLPASPAAD
jgi:hypothetical protein